MPRKKNDDFNEEVENDTVEEDIVEDEDAEETPIEVNEPEPIKEDVEEEDEGLGTILNSFTKFTKKTQNLEPTDGSKTIIPTGLDIYDAYSGGGITTSLTQIVGPPGGGKSALASNILGNAQRIYKGKCLPIYIDTESSMTTERLAQLGVRTPKIAPYNDATVEKVFKFVDSIVAFKDENPEYKDIPAVVVWDSIANTSTEKAVSTDDPNSVTGLKARYLSHILPNYVKILDQNKIALVAINQLRDKIDMGIFKTKNTLKFLGAKEIPGGKSLLFNSVHILEVEPAGSVIDNLGFRGITAKCKFIKNKLFSPDLDFELVMSFEHGFSNFWTNYNFLKSAGRIKGGGAWFTLTNWPTKKFQQKQAKEFFDSDQSFKEAWNEAVKDAIQTEIIGRYASTDDSVTDSRE